MTPSSTTQKSEAAWFPRNDGDASLAHFGFRVAGGGAHQSKTIMLEELGNFIMAAAGSGGAPAAVRLVHDENLFAKSSSAARSSTFKNLNQLYGLTTQPPIQRALAALWPVAPAGHPLLAMLCALARDPLLRDTAEALLSAAQGEVVEWSLLAAELEAKHPGRFSAATIKSLAQNCNASWTQSGHLKGTRNKRRVRPIATPEVAAYAVLLARHAGFGGPALLGSIWLRVLDVAEDELMSLLRQAQGRGFMRLRQGGAVLEIEPTIGLAPGAV